MRIGIYGAGIAGLAAAHHLRGAENDVTLFEAADRPGGNIRTERFEDCLLEWGPNGFLDSEPAVLRLVSQLGLQDHLVRARPAAARRFLFRKGRLREMPISPGAFLKSSVMPLTGRLRVLLEPFAREAPKGDESVYDFARRRLGRHAANTLVSAFVTGVYAGDPKRLSARSAFPKLVNAEREHGSLLRAARRGGGGPGPKGTLTSFAGGMEVIIRALAEGAQPRLGTKTERIEQDGFDRVVCAVPAPRAAPLFEGELRSCLQRIPAAPLAVVATVFDEPLDVPDAFGFLAPRGEGLRSLGTVYESSLFEGRAPPGRRLFRTMVGGRLDPEAVGLADDALVEIVLRDLRRAWGFAPKPRAVRIVRHRLGIAQYELGHAEIVARIEALGPDWLRFAGSSYRGTSFNACVREALEWSP